MPRLSANTMRISARRRLALGDITDLAGALGVWEEAARRRHHSIAQFGEHRHRPGVHEVSEEPPTELRLASEYRSDCRRSAVVPLRGDQPHRALDVYPVEPQFVEVHTRGRNRVRGAGEESTEILRPMTTKRTLAVINDGGRVLLGGHPQMLSLGAERSLS